MAGRHRLQALTSKLLARVHLNSRIVSLRPFATIPAGRDGVSESEPSKSFPFGFQPCSSRLADAKYTPSFDEASFLSSSHSIGPRRPQRFLLYQYGQLPPNSISTSISSTRLFSSDAEGRGEHSEAIPSERPATASPANADAVSADVAHSAPPEQAPAEGPAPSGSAEAAAAVEVGASTQELVEGTLSETGDGARMRELLQELLKTTGDGASTQELVEGASSETGHGARMRFLLQQLLKTTGDGASTQELFQELMSKTADEASTQAIQELMNRLGDGASLEGAVLQDQQQDLRASSTSEADGYAEDDDDDDEDDDDSGVDLTAGLGLSMAGAPKRVQRFLIQKMLKVKPAQPVSTTAFRKKFQMRIVDVNRTAKVTKGGKVVSFGALVVCGNGNGVVGFGRGKSAEVGAAVDKAFSRSLRNLHYFERYRGRTVSQPQMAKYGKTKVHLWPARKGSSMSAGATVGGILRLAGFTEVKTKVIGSRNPINTVKATFKALGLIDARSEAAQQDHATSP